MTIVATKATQSGKALTLEDPQIVNGLQTSTEIHRYFRSTNTGGDSRNLLVRVIVPTKPESRDRIIKATNSQTTIPLASLRATDKIHRDIEEYLKPFGFYYDRRKNSHKNEGRPLDQIVSIALMAQSIMSILLRRPNDARARPSSLLKKNEDYEKLFSSEYPIEIYRVCSAIMKKVGTFLRSRTELDAKDRNNLRFYVAMHLGCCLTKSRNPNINQLIKCNFENIDDALLQASYGPVHDAYVSLGATDQTAKGAQLLEKVGADLAAKFS